jgi:hypothetical protein
MSQSTDDLIREMTEDLTPVKSLRLRNGLLLVVGALMLTLIALEAGVGLWRGVWQGEASTFYILTNGLLLLLGCAATGTVLRMASPQVGNQHEGPRWAAFAVALLPIAAMPALVTHEHPGEALDSFHGLKCMGLSLVAATLTAGVLYGWLRRGAPVSPTKAGLHLGIASTALGSAAYGLACPMDGEVHLGIWHVMPVLFGALVGRLVLPSLLRW